MYELSLCDMHQLLPNDAKSPRPSPTNKKRALVTIVGKQEVFYLAVKSPSRQLVGSLDGRRFFVRMAYFNVAVTRLKAGKPETCRRAWLDERIGEFGVKSEFLPATSAFLDHGLQIPSAHFRN
jgi:hypothetical protein